MKHAGTELVVELLSDGGIRLTTPRDAAGLATAAAARQWIAVAAGNGEPVRITGDVESQLGRAVIGQLELPENGVTIEQSTPTPWQHGWTTLQVASRYGHDDIVKDLLARGASAATWRRDHRPYRLAMYGLHFDVMRTLRDAGASLPPGSQPPAELPDAVVARFYLPSFIWWLAGAVAVFGVLGAAVAAPVFGIENALAFGAVFLVVAACNVLLILVANMVLGRTRIAVDGPRLSVRQVLRWQGPIDLRRLVAVGFTPSISPRYASNWHLIQREAGPPYRFYSGLDLERELASLIRSDRSLRAIRIYHRRDYREAGLPRHLARYILDSQALLGANAQVALTAAGALRAAEALPPVPGDIRRAPRSV